MNGTASDLPRAYLPSAWKPRHRDDLVRLGSVHDGGYVVTESIIKHTDFLVGLGIGTDWTFEQDFHNQKRCPVHCYDHTVSLRNFIRYAERELKYLVSNPRRISAIRSYPSVLLAIKYKAFFSGKRKHFKEKIGDDPEHYTNFKKIFSRIPASDKVFIKMDIEGWEYRALPGLRDHYERLTGLTVEFHHVNTMLDTVRRHVSELTKSFDIVHVHVNNGCMTDERAVPYMIEMTFESKGLYQGPVRVSERTYPVDGIDSPNDAHRTDYRLEFRDDI